MSFSQQLLAWFEHSGRKDLPWQAQSNLNHSAYHVWLSEIMLQQTQVNTVIPYYLRFTKQYPNLKALAEASQDDILALWTGLGYYARARNLHKASIIMVEKHNAELPPNLEELIALPGIGRSTAGAIMSLAYHQRYSILDGNVKRVLARYHRVPGWTGIKAVENKLWAFADKHLPSQNIANYIQAQMDLGATVCTRSKPQCDRCPLQQGCQAYQHDIPQNYPEAKPKKNIPTRDTHWLILQRKGGKVLLEQRPSSGVWGGLWSFPEVKSIESISEYCLNKFQIKTADITATPSFKHIFSHFKLHIHPQLIDVTGTANTTNDNNTLSWYEIDDALQLGLPAPVKTFLQSLLN